MFYPGAQFDAENGEGLGLKAYETEMNRRLEVVKQQTPHDMWLRHGGVDTLELRHLVEVAVGEVGGHCGEGGVGTRDVAHEPVLVELAAHELGLHHVGGAVELLGRAEDLAPEAVGDHHAVADGDESPSIQELIKNTIENDPEAATRVLQSWLRDGNLN